MIVEQKRKIVMRVRYATPRIGNETHALLWIQKRVHGLTMHPRYRLPASCVLQFCPKTEYKFLINKVIILRVEVARIRELPLR